MGRRAGLWPRQRVREEAETGGRPPVSLDHSIAALTPLSRPVDLVHLLAAERTATVVRYD